jgi:predicted acylesterase/phospholipase RssA
VYRGAGSVQRYMQARESHGLGVACGRCCWRGRQLLFSFGRTASRIVLAALAAALLQRATGFSGGGGPTAFLAPPLRGAPALAGPIWTSPQRRATGPFDRRQWHAPRALFHRDADPAQPQDDHDTKSPVTAFRDDSLDLAGGPASANGSSGRQERLLSTPLAFDNALPYWGWPSLPLVWPANASGPNPFASAGAGTEADTAKAEKPAQSLDEKNAAAELKRLRREVGVLRQVLQRERSKTQRLRTAQSGAAQSVAAASNVENSSARSGLVAGVLSNTGRAISSGATAVVSTPYKWGSAAAGAIKRINVSGVWQATKNTSSKVWGKKERMPVRTVEEFNALLKSGVSIDDIDVRGRSQPWRQDEIGQIIVAGPSQTKGQLETTNESVIEVNNLLTVLGDKSAVRGDGRWRQLQHPVLRAIWERKKSGSQPGARTDGYKIALAIEGGGLRGSVTAGMSAAVMELGVHDCFDLVLGSSAGSIIGTYLLGSTEARAHQETTYEFFCNHLTTSQEKLNGSSWLDMGRLVDLFTPEVPFSRMRSGSTPSRGLKGKNKPGRYAMMALDYPMKTIMQELLPVNWEKFQERNSKQPIKIIASGLFSERSVRLGSQEGSFNDLPSLCECIKASCMLPGVAGVEPPWLKGSSAQNPDVLKRGLDEYLEQELETSPALWTQARNAFMKQMQRRRNSLDTRRKASGIQRVFSQSADPSNVTDMPGMNQTEVFAALEDLGLTPTLEELELLVKMSDVNFDGLIDLDEFKGMVYFLTTQHLASSQSNSSLILNTALENKTLDLKSFKPEVEPMVDALLYEPIPYRSAIEQGCTHVLVLRSYPDGRRMPQGYLGLFERLVAPKCLDPFPRVKDYMISLKHSERYSEDILQLNEGVAPALASANEVDDAVQSDDAREVGRLLALECAVWQGVYNEDEVPVGVGLGPAGPHLLAVAPLDTDGEAIRALELDKSVLLRGIMQGFARAYDMLVPDDHGGETGDQVSKNIFLPIHYRYLENLARAENKKKKEVGGRADERVPKSLIDLDKILLPKSLIDLSSQRSLTTEVETEGTSAVDGKNAAKLSFWTVRSCAIAIDSQ